MIPDLNTNRFPPCKLRVLKRKFQTHNRAIRFKLLTLQLYNLLEILFAQKEIIWKAKLQSKPEVNFPSLCVAQIKMF